MHLLSESRWRHTSLFLEQSRKIGLIVYAHSGNNPQNSAIQKTESITMNLYYTGTDGNGSVVYQEVVRKIGI